MGTMQEVREVAARLNAERDNLNRALQKAEEALRAREVGPADVVVILKPNVFSILAWDGKQLLWNGERLRSCSMEKRVAAARSLKLLLSREQGDQHA